MRWVSEVADMVNNLINYNSCDDINGLFGIRSGVCCLECLLSSESFTSDGFTTDVNRKHLEKGVCLIVSSSQCEQERLEDPIGQGLGNDVLDIGSTELSGCWGIVQELWDIRWDLGEDIRRWLNREVGEVCLGYLDDKPGQFDKGLNARSRKEEWIRP